MINIGIIGTGFGSTQTKVFQGLEGSQVIALVGADYKKTKKISEMLRIPHVFPIADELIHADNIDVICIATPNHLHKPMFLKALRTGKHIILEKPAGLNSSEILEMKEAAEGYEPVIVVDHPLRFNPVTKRIQEAMTNG